MLFRGGCQKAAAYFFARFPVADSTTGELRRENNFYFPREAETTRRVRERGRKDFKVGLFLKAECFSRG